MEAGTAAQTPGRDAKQTPVLVFGTGTTALGVVRALGRRGIRAFSTEAPMGGIQWSRWHRAASKRAPAKPSPVALSEYLVSLELDRAVLIACNDDWARCLAAREPALRKQFAASVGPPESIDRLVDKAGLASTLREAGVPHPETRILESTTDLDSVPDALLAQSFLKPADSQRFGPLFGAKALAVTSRGDAAEKFARARKAGISMLLQEYVPGPPTNHYFVDGFRDAGGTVRALFARQRFRMYPHDFGNSSYMGSIPVDAVRPAADSIEKLLRHVRYRGIFSAEFKRDERDGIFKLIEVNARPWWYVEFAARCGVDVCYLAYLDALEQPVPTITEYRSGVRLVHSWADYKAWGERRRHGAAAWRDHWGAWIGSQRAVFVWDDPLPAFANIARAVTSKVTAMFGRRGD